MHLFLRRFWAAYRHELQQLHTQATTYIFLTFAWVAMALCTFYLGGFFSRNEADLTVFFTFQPWIYLFFLPAISMGSWAEEWRRGTAERLLTLPVSPLILTLAKFKALCTLLLLVLIGTFPMVATVFWLGEPDVGPMITGYIGCLLVGSAMLSMALAASMLARSQASGFVLGLLVLFIFLASGWGLLTRLLEGFLPQVVVDTLIRFSLLDRFRNFNEGIVDVRDVFFFISLTLGFLAITHAFLVGRRAFKKAWVLLVASIVLIIGGNWALERVLWQWDATPAHVHTLDPATVNFLRNLDLDVDVTFYFSADNAEVPVPIQQFSRRIMDKLRDMRSFNPARFHVQYKVPERDINIEAEAQKRGIQEIPLPSGEGYYLGLALNSGDRGTRLPMMSPIRASFLEFDLMSALVELQKTRSQKIGILTDLDLGNDRMRPKFIQDLLDVYDLSILKPGEPVFDPSLDLIILFMTPFFDQENLYALDQYLVNAGKVLLVLDPYLRTSPDPSFLAPDRNADDWAFDHPADLLRAWGVEYDYNRVVGDTTTAMPVRLPGIGAAQYPLWLSLEGGFINHDLPFTANVNSLLLAESGFFTPQKITPTLTYESILHTPETSQVIPRSLLSDTDPSLLGNKLQGEKKERDLAFMLSGHFQSAFNGVSPAAVNYYKDYAEDPEKVVIPEHVKQSDKQGALVVLGDLDFLSDDYALSTEKVMGEVVQRPANDNLGFFYNVIQYLLGDRVLLPIRGKGDVKHPFTRVEAMMSHVSHKYQKVEQELVAELFHVARRLRELQGRAYQRQKLETQISKEIEAFQKRELDVKKRLRHVRRTLRQDISSLERRLAVFNLSLMPLLVWIYAVIFFYSRRRKARLA